MQGAVIRQAFESAVEVLGLATKESLVEDLKIQGIFLNDPEITLSKIFEGLEGVMGREIAELFAERLLIKLDELYSMQRNVK